jgi:transposase-like protein
MGLEREFTRLIDSAPRVECARCNVDMTLRTLLPVPKTEKYRSTFRCPKCGTDVQREFTTRCEPDATS